MIFKTKEQKQKGNGLWNHFEIVSGRNYTVCRNTSGGIQ